MLRNARPESARNQWPNWSGKRTYRSMLCTICFESYFAQACTFAMQSVIVGKLPILRLSLRQVLDSNVKRRFNFGMRCPIPVPYQFNSIVKFETLKGTSNNRFLISIRSLSMN